MNPYLREEYYNAALNGDIKLMIKLELKGIININIKNCFGHNAYSLAAYRGHIKILKYLESHVNYVTTYNDYLSIFFRAIRIDNIKIMKYIESKGLNINIKNISNENAYLIAARCGCIHLMKYLESKGINIYIRDRWGNNAYLCAVSKGNIKTKKYIIKNRQYKINKYNYIYLC